MPPERENDIHIMDWVCQNREIFKDNNIKIINYCRLYLHVTTLSELFDAQGDTMLDYMYQCRRPPWFNSRQYITIQRRPSEHQITKKWKRLCHMWCSPTTLKRLSKISLGPWTHKATGFRPHRQSYIEVTDHEHIQLYHFHDNKYWTVRAANGRNNTVILQQPTEWRPGPRANPITLTTHSIQPDGSRFQIKGHNPQYNSNPATALPANNNFKTYISNLAPWIQDLIGSYSLHQPHHLIHQLLRALPEVIPKIYLASSGRVTPDKIMIYSWVVGTPRGTIIASGRGVGRGPPTLRRCETWAQLSCAFFFQHFHDHFSPEQQLQITNIITHKGLAKHPIRDTTGYTTLLVPHPIHLTKRSMSHPKRSAQNSDNFCIPLRRTT
jgi:hypothetical protein